MAKSFKAKCVSISANKNASIVQLAEAIESITPAAPGAPNATAKTIATFNFQKDPSAAFQFVPDQEYTVTIE